jgi:hypothetical protein
MTLKSRKDKRLSTENFKHVSSRAVRSIDFSSLKNILEVKFITGEVYHYLNVKKKLWNTILGIIKSRESLGAFINQQVKPYHDYYQLIVTSTKEKQKRIEL